MVISAGAIAFLALSAVSIRVIHTPRAPSQPLAAGLPAVSGTIPVTGGSACHRRWRDPRRGGRGQHPADPGP